MADNADTGQAEAPVDDNDAGRRIGRDEIDPDLVKLGRFSGSTGPLLSISIIVFCVYFMIILRGDLVFSRQGDEPRKIDRIGVIVDGDVDEQEFIKLRAVPDYARTAMVVPGEGKGHRVAPVLGTDARFWVMLPESWADEAGSDQILQGRVRRISKLPFADTLARFLEKQPPAPRFVDNQALENALVAKASSIKTLTKDTIAVSPGSPMVIKQTDTGRVKVRAFRRKAQGLGDAAAWSRALTDAGVNPGSAQAASEDAKQIFFELPAPDGLDAVKAALIAAELFAAKASVLESVHVTTWGKLAATDAGLAIDGGATIPWRHISAASVDVPRTLPDGALILVTDERPGSYWYVLPLYVLLGLFTLLFSWALVRSIKRLRAPDASPVAGAAA